MQYNLAKLCSFLCRDLHTFQDDMIASLLSFHDEQRSNLSDQQRKNLLLFFAEIYEKLESVSCFFSVLTAGTVFTGIFT